MEAEGQLTGTWGPALVRARLQVKRWGACDSKVQSALLNAESGRVYSRRQSVLVAGRLGGALRGLVLGAQWDRRSAHHVWRHRGRENRHPWFPGTWRVGRRGCEGGSVPHHPPESACPSLGYWGGARPYLGFDSGGVTASVRGPLLRWKGLTLPWPSVIGAASYEWGRWTVGVWAQGGGPQDWAAIARLRRRLPEGLFVEASFGRRPLPEWRRRDADVLQFTFGLH
jgi:hypothetical protein